MRPRPRPWQAALLLLACLGWHGCAGSEGGVTGTGINSSVTGNISLVTDDPQPETAALPFPIRVTIDEFPAIEATTDDTGTFALSGVFSGQVTLQFANAASGAPIGPLRLEIPTGSETVLENIEIRTAAPIAERVRPNAVRQFGIFGRVDAVECADDGTGTLLVSDDGRPPRQFLVHLAVETVISARGGEPRQCADLMSGAAVQVEGFLRRADQTIVAESVIIAFMRPPEPPPGPRPERLRGVVRAVACARGLIEVEQRSADEPLRRVVQLTEATEILCARDTPVACSCAEIGVGAPISVGGVIFPARPGVVVAETVVIDATLQRVTLVAVVAVAACDAGRVELRDPTSPTVTLRALLSRRTVIACGRQVCACTDLQPRDRVRVEGSREANRPSLIYAERLTVLPQRDGSP